MERSLLAWPPHVHPTLNFNLNTVLLISASMRYIRFLKAPRIITEKGTNKNHVYCLITITSDLGDSFFPYDVELAAELISPERDFQGDEVLVWRTIKWEASMRTLAITLPLKKSYVLGPLRVRVGVEPKVHNDTLDGLSQADSQGIVSAWSAEFSGTNGPKEAVKLVERRFEVARKRIGVWEETGESIARHLWYALPVSSFQLPKGSLLKGCWDYSLSPAFFPTLQLPYRSSKYSPELLTPRTQTKFESPGARYRLRYGWNHPRISHPKVQCNAHRSA